MEFAFGLETIRHLSHSFLLFASLSALYCHTSLEALSIPSVKIPSGYQVYVKVSVGKRR